VDAVPMEEPAKPDAPEISQDSTKQIWQR
jgi:hypothetical protein